MTTGTPSTAVARAALRLLDTRVNGRYVSRHVFHRAPPMTDDQAIAAAVRLGVDDPDALRQGALLLKSQLTRNEIALLAQGATT